MMSDSEVKAQAQERFGQFAQGYVESKGHASGDDLERLVELAQPQADWVMLDVATGGGHTALKFAPFVKKVVALDLTPQMLEAAEKFITSKGMTNVEYKEGDFQDVQMHDGSWIRLKKLSGDHNPTDRQSAIRLLEQARKEQYFVTGLIYIDTERPSLTDVAKLTDSAISMLGSEDIRPGEDVFKDALKSFKF